VIMTLVVYCEWIALLSIFLTGGVLIVIEMGVVGLGYEVKIDFLHDSNIANQPLSLFRSFCFVDNRMWI
jgi:hypothetical protein